VRLADVLPIEGSGISKDDYRFSLQSHFDFVVADNEHNPLFIVEFDGESHRNRDQKKRDIVKNRLCNNFALPLLRINSKYVAPQYRGMAILTWCIEVWFLLHAFWEAQESGLIPLDEPFSPDCAVRLPFSDNLYPLALSIEPITKIRELKQSGLCMYDSIETHFGKDIEGNTHGIAYLNIDGAVGVCAKSAIRSQQFPIVEQEILHEIFVFEIYDKLKHVLGKNISATPLRSIYRKIEAFHAHYETGHICIYLEHENKLISTFKGTKTAEELIQKYR
jgi:hypothetical protein